MSVKEAKFDKCESRVSWKLFQSILSEARGSEAPMAPGEREPEVARGHTLPEPELGKHLQYFAELMSQNDSHSDTDGAVLFVLEKL